MKKYLLIVLVLALSLGSTATGLQAENSNEQIISVGVDQSLTVPLKTSAVRVAVGNQEIVGTLLVSSRELLINGKKSGNTSLKIWYSDNSTAEFAIDVSQSAGRFSPTVFRLKNIRLEQTREEKGFYRPFTDTDFVTELEKALGTILEKTHFSISSRLNAIIVYAGPGDLEKVKSLVEDIDKPLPQIVMEAKIYEVKNTRGESFISDITHTNGQFSAAFNQSNGNIFTFDSNSNLANTFKDIINWKITQGEAKLLSEPQLMAMDGRFSDMLSGSRVPITHVDPQGNISAEYVETGIKLKATPRIDENRKIITWVWTEASSITGYTASGYPQIDVRRSINEVRLREGETVILAGLLKDNLIINETKFPILGDLLGWIPIVGNLFVHRSSSVENSELVISLTPKILDSEKGKP